MLSVAIVGGGPLGLALGLMLRQAGIDCEIFDARPAGAAPGDRRVLALSHGSRQILERLGAWRTLGATPIEAIHVSQQGSLGRTLIRAEDADVPALGYVACAGALRATLAEVCAVAGVLQRSDTRVVSTHAGDESILLRCATPRASDTIAAQLVAWAEGAASESDASGRREYGQHAIVARLSIPHPHGGVAFERFTADGPVALLPCGQEYALVWTVPDSASAGLLALDERAFLSHLREIFGGRQEFGAALERSAFPLGLRYRASPVAERAVWLGNAAQTLHPVAGQGFNLALRDAMQLARLLQEAPDDCGSVATLSRHAAARKADRLGVIAFTDGLVRLFGAPGVSLRHARGAGLLALDLMPAARRFIARRMIFGARAY